MSSLRSKIGELAIQFAAGVVSAVRGASLEDIVAETSRGAGGRGRSAGRAVSAEAAETAGKRAGRGRRLGRRSAGDIAQVVERIVGLLQENPKGLRAEQIKMKLGLQSKEMPRPIAEALASKKIS